MGTQQGEMDGNTNIIPSMMDDIMAILIPVKGGGKERARPW